MLSVPEKTALTLPLMEQFYTIQGEGTYGGYAAYFILVGGCDVGCVWCDVKESWDVSNHPLVSIDEMVARAKASGAGMVVITGGEPAMYDLGALTHQLQGAGLRTHIETSGAYVLTGNWDWICFSPKKFKAPHPTVPGLADELKVIIYNKSDFSWAEQFAALVTSSCQLFLQPEWSREKEMLPLIIDYVKANPKWRVGLQTHKYMGVE
jgi:7-carboxy-7-deazaguanine synthase